MILTRQLHQRRPRDMRGQIASDLDRGDPITGAVQQLGTETVAGTNLDRIDSVGGRMGGDITLSVMAINRC